jgi:hypothetical protein
MQGSDARDEEGEARTETVAESDGGVRLSIGPAACMTTAGVPCGMGS